MVIKTIQKHKKILLLLFIVAVIFEVFVANFRSWESMSFKQTQLTNAVLVEGGTTTPITGNKIQITEAQKKSEKVVIKFSNVNIESKNIYLHLDNLSKKNKAVDFKLYITDQSNKYPYKLLDASVADKVKESRYYRIYPRGQMKDIRLEIYNFNTRDTIEIKNIILNRPVPFHFSIGRFLAVLGILLIVWVFRPKSEFYTNKIGAGRSLGKKRFVVIAVLILANLIVLGCITIANPFYRNVDTGKKGRYYHTQYQRLTERILEGEFSLADEPSPSLKAMENPYDRKARDIENVDFLWDTAYYEGKYYVYFGITPVILVYLPYYAITGHHISNYLVTFLFMSLFVVSAFFLLYQLIKKYFKNVPFLLYILLCMFLVYGGGITLIASKPDFYSQSILLSVGFSMTAFGLWLMATEDAEKLKRVPLFLGAVCMALVAGGRPQLLLLLVVAFVMFCPYIFKQRQLLSVKGWKNTVAIALPLVAMAAFLMYYNYARFGSVFDFGGTYNLTTNDMTTRGFVPQRIIDTVFYYFLQPPLVTSTFPFLNRTPMPGNFAGFDIKEAMYGGILLSHPLNLMVLALKNVKANLKEKKLWLTTWVLLAIVVLLAIFSGQYAGILRRYIVDFAPILGIVVSLVVLSLHENMDGQESKRQNLYKIVLAGVFITVTYSFFIVFVQGYSTNMQVCNPTLYYKIKSIVQFWS